MPVPETREELEAFIKERKLSGAAEDKARALFADKQAQQAQRESTRTSLLGQMGRGAAEGVSAVPDLLSSIFQGPMPQPTMGESMGVLTGHDIQPETSAQGYARAGGRAVGQLPASMATGGGGAIVNALSNVAGEGTGEFLRQSGAPPWLQGMGNAVAGMGPGIMRALSQTRPVQGLIEKFSPAMQRSNAQQLARTQLRGAVSERGVPGAIQTLAYETDPATEAARFGTRLSTTQALGRPGLSVLERDVGRRVSDFGSDILEDKAVNLAKMQDHIDNTLATGGNPQVTKDALRNTHSTMEREVSNLFTEANPRDARIVQKNGLIRAVDSITDEVEREGGFNAKYMPKDLMDEIKADTSRNMTISELRGLEKRISNELYDARDNPTKARYLNMIMDDVEASFDRIVATGGDDARAANALRKAVSKRRQMGEFFNYNRKVPGQRERVPNTVIRAFNRHENPADAINEIFNSNRPKEDLAILRQIVGNEPEAWKGVEAVMHKRLFGDAAFQEIFQTPETKAGKGAIDSVVRKIKDEHELINGIYGDSRAAKHRIDFLQRLRKLKTRGVAGMEHEAIGAGSGVAEETVKKRSRWANARAVWNMHSGNYMGAATELMRILTPDHPPATYAEADRLLAVALDDPAYGRLFLEMRPARELPRIRDSISKIIDPSAIRGIAQIQREGERR